MAKLFLSHSSKDKTFVKKLAEDLTAFGHIVWLDEWEIRVGECILTKIDEGINNSDYVIIILSKSAVKSSWVEKEWKTKYWDEIEKKELFILPILKEECEIPNLLKTKKYADFSKNYAVGLNNLITSLGYHTTKLKVQEIAYNQDVSSEIRDLLNRIQSGNEKLSKCISECLSIANNLHDEELVRFCMVELKGLKNKESYPEFTHRKIEAFASINQINHQWIGWNGDLSQAISMMKNNKEEFWPTEYMIWQPIFEIEEFANEKGLENKIFSFSLTAKDLSINVTNPEMPVYIYAKAKAIRNVVSRTRNKLTELLLNKL